MNMLKIYFLIKEQLTYNIILIPVVNHNDSAFKYITE